MCVLHNHLIIHYCVVFRSIQNRYHVLRAFKDTSYTGSVSTVVNTAFTCPSPWQQRLNCSSVGGGEGAKFGVLGKVYGHTGL